MTEIHVGTSQTLFLDLYNETADELPTAVARRADGSTVPLTVQEATAPSGVTERYSTVVGLAFTSTEAEVEVEWNLVIDGSDIEKVDFLEVVTPYLSVAEIKSIVSGASDAEAIEIEAAVRHIINAHTGQTFGYSRGQTMTVEGHGEDALRLPRRLVNILGVGTLTANLDPGAFIIVSDGWYLKKSWANVVSTRDGESAFWGDYTDPSDGIYHDPDDSFNPPATTSGLVGPLGTRPGGVISVPGASGRITPWKNDYPFEITGDWGYKKVPAQVKQAAKLLVNDYACMESVYRDRYLDSVKASDWQLDFNSRAWDSTGNARADQLLSDFIIFDWAVI